MEGAAANPPNPPRLSASPGIIKKYMVQEGSKESLCKQAMVKNKIPEGSLKTGARRQKKLRLVQEGVKGQWPQKKQPVWNPNKKNSYQLRAKWLKCLQDWKGMNHIVKRVEETEDRLDEQGEEIKKLKVQLNEVQKDQRRILYQMEDQENRNRRKNLRIRGLPESQEEEEDLQG